MRRVLCLLTAGAIYALAASTHAFIAAPLEGEWELVEVDD